MKLARPPLIREEVYSHLRDQLIRGQLEPSQMLRVQDLAAELDVSKTPIHDALAQLVQEGLLESLPRGFQVKRYSEREALNTYQVRMRIEGLSARLAAENIDAAGRKLLQRQLKKIEAFAPTDFAAHIQADLQLHNSLAKLSQNDVLVDLTHSLTSRMLGFRVVTKDTNSNLVTRTQHEAIVNAVLAGKGDAAEDAMNTHISYFADLLKEKLTSGLS